VIVIITIFIIVSLFLSLSFYTFLYISSIRPYFSGCGRSVEGTFESIRDGTMSFSDLPPIQVIIGPKDSSSITSSNGKGTGSSSTGNGPWYFSLNNRRLWVLKRCREEGLLESVGNIVRVRVRECKSANESKRYTLENCALTATFLRERPPGVKSGGGGESKDLKKCGDGGGGDTNSEIVPSVTDGTRLLSDGDDDGVHSHLLVGNIDNNLPQIQDRDDNSASDDDNGSENERQNRGAFCKDADGISNTNDCESNNDESEEDITSSTPKYVNPFCVHGDSSSSDEDSD